MPTSPPSSTPPWFPSQLSRPCSLRCRHEDLCFERPTRQARRAPRHAAAVAGQPSSELGSVEKPLPNMNQLTLAARAESAEGLTTIWPPSREALAICLGTAEFEDEGEDFPTGSLRSRRLPACRPRSTGGIRGRAKPQRIFCRRRCRSDVDSLDASTQPYRKTAARAGLDRRDQGNADG